MGNLLAAEPGDLTSIPGTHQEGASELTAQNLFFPSSLYPLQSHRKGKAKEQGCEAGSVVNSICRATLRIRTHIPAPMSQAGCVST